MKFKNRKFDIAYFKITELKLQTSKLRSQVKKYEEITKIDIFNQSIILNIWTLVSIELCHFELCTPKFLALHFIHHCLQLRFPYYIAFLKISPWMTATMDIFENALQSGKGMYMYSEFQGFSYAKFAYGG